MTKKREAELKEEIDNLLCRCSQAYDTAAHKTLLVRAHRDEIFALFFKALPELAEEAGYKSPVEIKNCKEKIAEELFFQDWDSETAFATYNATNGNWAEQTDEHFREHYYKRADQIIRILKGEE